MSERIKLKTADEFLEFYRGINPELYEGYARVVDIQSFMTVLTIYYDGKSYEYSIEIDRDAKSKMSFEDVEKAKLLIREF